MKSFIIALCLFACAYASGVDSEAEVLQNVYNQSPDGNYGYAYETNNGISGQATGQLKTYGKDEAGYEVEGSNSYTAPDGTVIKVTYKAGPNGYEPSGAHLPTPPPPQPIPEYIAKAIEYILANPYKEEN